jgi:hypothetical protein
VSTTYYPAIATIPLKRNPKLVRLRVAIKNLHKLSRRVAGTNPKKYPEGLAQRFSKENENSKGGPSRRMKCSTDCRVKFKRATRAEVDGPST